MDKDKIQEIADEIVMNMCETSEIDFGDLNISLQCQIIETACQEYHDRNANKFELMRATLLCMP